MDARAGKIAQYQVYGATTFGLYGDGATAPASEVSVPATNVATHVALTASAPGLQRLHVDDPGTGVGLDWDVTRPMVTDVGEGAPIPFAGGTWDAYFYVPKGTTTFVVYGGGGTSYNAPAMSVLDSKGNAVLAAADVPLYGHTTVTVPEGQDGALWQIKSATTDHIRLYGVPPQVGRSAFRDVAAGSSGGRRRAYR